jgi:hypothetical protein
MKREKPLPKSSKAKGDSDGRVGAHGRAPSDHLPKPLIYNGQPIACQKQTPQSEFSWRDAADAKSLHRGL